MISTHDVKKTIFEILKLNSFVQDKEGVLETFDYKVIRSQWSPVDGVFKFVSLVSTSGETLPESATEVAFVREQLTEKETFYGGEGCGMLPRLVLVHYVENTNADYNDVPNSVRPPIGDFKQRGMVMNLENGEILCAGSSWMNTVQDMGDFATLVDISRITGQPIVQKPMEGASINMFFCPLSKEIFIGTSGRVLKLSKILHGSGSRWNFYGKTEAQDEQFNIHSSALNILLEIGMEYMGLTASDVNGEEIIDFVKMIFRSVYFPIGKEDLVYTGILSGLPFANHSRTMTLNDYERMSFTLSVVLRRRLDSGSGRTLWTKEKDTGYCNRLFLDHCLDTYKFTAELPVGGNVPEEDILLIWPVEENGIRTIYRYQSPQSLFRERVIRGSDAGEIEDIVNFFPLHRNRRQGAAANIRERVRQVITLAIRGAGPYSFDKEAVLGGDMALYLRECLIQKMSALCSDDLRRGGSFRHWQDVAFPMFEFLVPNNVSLEHALGARNIPLSAQRRLFQSHHNRRLCNALVVLFSSVSVALRDVVVEEISRFFISRMLIASLAFIPSRLFEQFKNSYLSSPDRQQQPSHVTVPIGVHKMNKIIPPEDLTPSKRKYRIADKISKLSFLDVRFIMTFVNHRSSDLSVYHPIVFGPGS